MAYDPNRDAIPPNHLTHARDTGRRGMPVWGWILIIAGGLVLLSCACCGGGLIFIGASSPDTWVYAGNEVPSSYAASAEDLGLLDDDEQLLWYYSDALFDVTEGFYFVSNKKVVVYIASAAEPETAVTFDQIVSADLYRDTSFLNDSVITLGLKDGSVVSFPVSSERDRDIKFFEAIEQRIEPVTP